MPPLANVHALPNEVLLLVFRHVHKPWLCPQEFEDSALSPSLFPFAPASVCRRWHDVIAMVPTFWTHLVFIIDTARPAYVETWLHLSRELPIDIVVTRPHHRTPKGDVEERDRVAVIMKLVAPHLRRCRFLHFHVIRSSSLPELRKDFRGNAPLLETLHLQCREDDGDHRFESSQDSWDFTCPALQDLLLNGHNCCVTLRDDLSWYRKHQSINKFTVSHYTHAEPKTGTFCLDDMLQLFSIIGGELTIRDVLFDNVNVQKAGYELRYPSLTLWSLDAITVDLIVRYTSRLGHRILQTCDILDSTRRLTFLDWRFGGLSVENRVEGLIQNWQGEHLEFRNCASFDDSFLNHLAGRWREEGLLCPFWHSLSIHGCLQFSIGALKTMIKTRQEAAFKLPINALDTLSISGIDVSEDDIEWFQENVLFFTQE